MKIKIILLCLIIFWGNIMVVNGQIITDYQGNNQASSSIYSDDLDMIEKNLFGKTYSRYDLISRIEHIEKKLFNKIYNDKTVSSRMNNILKSYRNNSYWTLNNGNGYCAPNKSVFTKLRNALIGVPTGYTPQIEPSPYINSYGPSYMQGFYGSNGWNSHNTYSPTVTGTGIHILN